MHEAPHRWDLLDMLEGRVRQPDFNSRWRAFLRDCTLLLRSGLPPEASAWATAADEFEAGRMDVDDLTAARVQAWQFHDARRDAGSLSELSALRVAMYRLWPPDEPDCWEESAWQFLDFCREAGLRDEQLRPLLRNRFADIFGGKA